MTQNHEQSRSEPDLEPGADRFWGQFSRTRVGRSQSTPDEERGDGPSETAGEGTPTGKGEPGHDHAHSHLHDHECLEWCPICRSAELIRTAVPPELKEQAEAFQREAVNIFRAFLTAYSERTGNPDPPHQSGPAPENPVDPEPEEPRVTDIPLD